jgi:aquaporin SIP
VIGYIVGVKLLMNTIPEVGHGPRLNVDIYRGALTEGILTFAIVVITLGIAATKIRGSFFLKTWISSIIKLTLHKLGSDLTGGCMNPASVSTIRCYYYSGFKYKQIFIFIWFNLTLYFLCLF